MHRFSLQLVDSITELTTGITDALIAIECVAIAFWLLRSRTTRGFRRKIWCTVFFLTAISSVLGALAHGLKMPNDVRAWLWIPLYLSLGILVALFLVAAIADWRGPTIANRFLPWAIAAGIIFFAMTRWLSDAFSIFVVYEAIFLLTALAIYSFQAFVCKSRGATVLALAILLNLIAAAAQASNLFIVIFLPFDHNGVFHILQMAGIAVLAWGLHLIGNTTTLTHIAKEKPNAGL